MYQFNEQFTKAYSQFADAAANANRLALENAEKAFGLHFAAFEESANATFAYVSELIDVRDADGLKAVWPKGLQVARANAERSLGATRPIAPMLAGGPGAAWEWRLGQRPLLGYVFLENQLLSHAGLQKNWAIGTGPLVGVLRDLGEHSRVQIEAGRQWYIDRRLERSSFRARLRSRVGPHSNLVAGYEWTQLELPDTRSTERSIQLGWQLYF